MIEPKYKNLNALFADRVFRIPKYQRYYSWGSKQRNDLFADIKQLKEKGVDRDHFMATIVCYQTDEVKEIGSKEYRLYDIVDGQQRLTTLIILLKCVHLALGAGEEKDELGKIIVKSDGNLILLQTNNTNKHIFNSFIRDGVFPARDKVSTHADRNIFQGVRECNQFVEKWTEDYGDSLSLLRIIRNKLGFVVFDTDDSRVVYSLFEVLNSRGLAVDWLDKCKSSLMGIAFEKAKTDESRASYIEELNDLWGNIYKELSMYPVPGQEILRVTATLYTGTESGKPQKAESALASLTNACSSSDDTVKISNRILGVAEKLVKLQSNIHLGPVTDVLQARVLAVAISLTDSVTEDERLKILEQWEKVTFRIYGLFAKDSRSKVGDYVRLANKIMNKSGGASRYSEIMSALRDIGSDYPIERAVEEELKGKDIYDGNQEVVRYLLWRYEEHLAKKAGVKAVVNEEIKAAIWQARSANESIEHVMPQNPEPGGAWDGKTDPDGRYELIVNGIGNLILLPQAINSEAKIQGFIAKKGVYRKSEGLRMVQEILVCDDWSQKEIEEREKKLLEWVNSEWSDLSD
ncbi:DUF262 domain-containing protein [Halomonas sp.]|uniref:DUF262 domain-containing protein n=1 Tax=Halomonas sp. TaxID=1486246 RepID=UPI00384CE32D